MQLNQYNFNVDYDTSTNCEYEGCDSICRCSRIKNAIVKTSMNNFIALYKAVWEKTGDHVLDLAAFYFVKARFKSCDFEINIGRGYYGEEISGISYHGKDFSIIKNVSAIEIIKSALINEYGILLPALHSCQKLYLKELSVTDIVERRETNCNDYNSFVSYNNKNELINYFVPLVTPVHNKYKMIDGHHRLNALDSTNPNLPDRLVLVIE